MKKGFTFIEMAVVLILIGILSGFGTMKLVTSMAQARTNMEENERLLKLTGGVIQFTGATVNKVLPNNTEFEELALSNMNERTIAYRRYNNGSVCSQTAAGKTFKVCRNRDCSTFDNVTNVAFAVFVGGINNRIDLLPDAAEVEIPYTGTNDDYVKFVTFEEVRSNVGCGGELTVVNDAFPKITADGKNFKDIMIEANYGVPTGEDRIYEWCIEMADYNRFFSEPTETKTKMYSIVNIVLPGNCAPAKFMTFPRAQLQPVLSYSHTKLPSGNYPINIFVRDTTGKVVKKENILTITDLVAMPNHDLVESVSRKYGCITVNDNVSGDVLICRKRFDETAKIFCKVPAIIDENSILNATTCDNSIEKLYTPATGTK